MADVALITISSKGQHVLRVKVPPLFPSYASGCPHSFLPCRVAFLPTEGSSAWWQHGYSRTGTDRSCHKIREKKSWGWSRALDFQGDPTSSGDRRSTSWGDTPISQPTAIGRSWQKRWLKIIELLCADKEMVNRETTKGTSPLVFSQLLKNTII